MWVKIDDRFDQHPKWAMASAVEVHWFLFALCYCNTNLTDGFIPQRIAVHLLGEVSTDKARRNLLKRGVISASEKFGFRGYLIHDYDKYQPSKAEVEHEKKLRNARQQRWRNAKRNASTSLSTNASNNAAPVPDPVPDPVSVPSPSAPVQEEPAPSAPVSASGFSLESPVPQRTDVPTHSRIAKKNGRAASGAERAQLIEWFDELFWQHYPKRKDKQAALKAWLKLHPSRVLAERIRDAVIEQKSWPTGLGDSSEHQRFVKYPATWLNAGAWDDDPPETSITDELHLGEGMRHTYGAISAWVLDRKRKGTGES